MRKPALAHATPLAAATVAAAAISLSVFALPGEGIPSGPTPLVPAFGAAAEHVAANLPVVVPARAPRQRVTRAVLAPARVSTPTAHVVPQRRAAAPKAQPVHVRAVRSTIARPPSAGTKRLFGVPAARGKARGHAHAKTWVAGTAHLHGLGHAHEHGRAREEHGHGNGHRWGKQ